MSEPSYTIGHQDLVDLLALVCAHGILGERENPAEADDALERSNQILERTGVRDAAELNEEVGIALALIVPEDTWPGEQPDGSATLPIDIPEDPYEWESGT